MGLQFMTEKISSKITTTAAEDKVDSGRRGFIKKAGYTAPAVVALGLLGRSQGAHADFGDPPSLHPANSGPSKKSKPSRG